MALLVLTLGRKNDVQFTIESDNGPVFAGAVTLWFQHAA
jgi:hypothetical protein